MNALISSISVILDFRMITRARNPCFIKSFKTSVPSFSNCDCYDWIVALYVSMLFWWKWHYMERS